MLANPQGKFWETTASALTDSGTQLTWYLAGTLPNAEQALTVVVLIERFEPDFASRIGLGLLQEALTTNPDDTQ
jgi:hypothetical protein